ncbi:MAG: permease-like cell division protein FtsX [Mycobacterium sp.]
MRFGFLFNEVLTGFRRNVTMTIAMILTVAISVGLFGGGMLVIRLADNSRDIYLDRVETQVFLTEDISANDPTCESAQCRAVQDEISAQPNIESVDFINRDEAFADVQRRLPEFEIKNRDLVPASFVVKLADPENHEEFDNALIGFPGVRGVPLNQKDLIDRLFSLLDSLRDAAFAVAVVQAIGAILLIANMVQVAAYTRRTEVGIMRLVGATRWYTQLPFLVEAMLAAFIGVVLAVVGLIAVRAFFLDSALEQFYQTDPPLIAKIDYLDILYISPWLFFVGVAMAGVTAYVTLRLYVRR